MRKHAAFLPTTLTRFSKRRVIIYKYFKDCKHFLPRERTLQATDQHHLRPIFGNYGPIDSQSLIGQTSRNTCIILLCQPLRPGLNVAFYTLSDICSQQTAGCRLQTADYRLQTTDCRLQITDCMQWTSDRTL